MMRWTALTLTLTGMVLTGPALATDPRLVVFEEFSRAT